MKGNGIFVAALAGLLGTSTPLFAGDWSQLIASAGLTPSEAAGMTLTEIYAYKINREVPDGDRVTVSSRSYPVFDTNQHRQLVMSARETEAEAAGKTLSEVAAVKLNLGSDPDEQIPVLPKRLSRFDATGHPQLVAAAGLTVEEASGMTLTEVYVRKVNREARGDDRQAAAD